MDNQAAIHADKEFGRFGNPQNYNAVRKVLEEQWDGENATLSGDIIILGLKVAEATVFPADMFEYDDIIKSGEIGNRLEEIKDDFYDSDSDNPDEKVNVSINYDDIQIMSKALAVYKGICMAYNPNRMRKKVEDALAAGWGEENGNTDC